VAESADIRAGNLFCRPARSRDRCALIVASTEGGVEIEAVAAKSPEKIIREPIDPLAGLQPYQGANWQSNSVSNHRS
jgi:succinyl-CoA synthetase beta subunit